MSSGGVFKLIANDGKADRLIMATKLINQRIKDVMCARKRAGKADITPTLVDLERTHILFVNAHFKPFAAIGYEYNKVRPQSGNPSLGNTITFSIPQFGDFFHDMVCRQVLSAFESSDQVAPTQGVAGYPADGLDWDNTTALAGSTYTLVDAFGNPVADEDTYRNFVRYCEYPGERLFRKVKFEVNGNPLDDYDDTTINMLRKFTIGADKIVGYKKLVGQEVCHEGFSGPTNVYAADSHNDGAQPFTTVDANLDPTVPQHSVNPVSSTNASLIAAEFPDAAWALDPASISHDVADGAAAHGYLGVIRKCLQAADGPQTPKYQQPQLEIFNKLRFWFNDDARLAIPSVSIPYGQRFITIDLATQAELAFEFPSLYVQQQVSAGVDTVLYRPWVSPGTISDIALSRVELYVNNIFVNPEIHDIYIKRIGFSLIRVFRQHRATSNAEGSDEKLLSQIKWPIEYMFVGLRPAWNTNAQNANQWRDWHKMTKVNDYICDDVDRSPTSRIGQVVPDSFSKELKTVDELSVTAHGINLYDAFPERFFNSYQPFHFGGPAVVTPEDEGALMVNFSLYPRSYQPSGHVNVSRAREFYLKWTSRYVTSATSAELIAIGVALNFLLITDGSAVLRFST